MDDPIGPVISRRKFLKNASTTAFGVAMSGSIATFLLEACSGAAATKSPTAAASASLATPASGSAGEVVYAGFGGAYQQKLQKAVLTPFQQATGINVKITTGASNVAELKAMVDAGKTDWDIIDCTGATLGQFISEQLLQKVDYSKIDTSVLTDQSYANPYGLGYYVYSHNIYWNTKVIPAALNNWADVWNTSSYPGKRGFLNTPDYVFEESLLADGVPMAQLYPLDVKRAFQSLDKIKSSAVFLDLNTLTNQVVQQDVVTGDLNLTRVQTAISDGAPLKYNWQQTLVDVNRFAIPKGAKNVDNAVKLMQYVLTPDVQIQIFKILGYSPAVKSAFSQLTTAQQANLAASPANKAQSVFISPDWWAKNGASVRQQYQQWLVS